MDRETRRIVENYRRDDAGPLENQVIDELLGGEVDRQEFLQRATMYGLGAGTIGALLRFAGESDVAYGASLEAVQAGGTIRLGIPVFGASLEPYAPEAHAEAFRLPPRCARGAHWWPRSLLRRPPRNGRSM